MLLEIIFVAGKTVVPIRHCICRCDTCEKEFEVSHCVKVAIEREHHFCSRECSNIAQRKGGLTHEVKKRIFHNHYGVEHPLQSKKIQDILKSTCQERYGVEHPLQSQEVKDKMRETCQEKYNVDYHTQSKNFKEKTKATYLELYGVEHPMHCKEIFDKVQSSSWDTTQIIHWKTGEVCNCRASYEVAVVRWLNQNKFDFEWQIQIPTPLLTPKGYKAKYTIDLHILDGVFADTWVEIKGREYHMEKWEWFHSTHLNSELWNKKKLKELGIL